MNRNDVAKELAHLGNSDFRLLSRLAAIHTALEVNRKRRCELLSLTAKSAGLDDDVTATVIEPKDDKDGKGG